MHVELARAAILLHLAAAACSGPGPASGQCAVDAAALGRADALRAEGWLHQGLAAAEAEQRRCASAAADLAVAAALADLGLDRRALAAYQAATAHGGATATTAAAAITELRARPPATRTPTAEQAEQARARYRDGVNLRLAGKPDDAIRQLRRAYALAPHPLTVVQIALAHRAAGRDTESRKASARALALAEDGRKARAVPRLRGGHSGEIRAIAFHPRGHLLASAGADGTARVWELATGRELHLLPHGREQVSGVGFAGDTLVTAVEATSTLHTWDADTGAALDKFRVRGSPSRLAAAGKMVAVGGFEVEVIDMATGHIRARIPATSVDTMALSPDGRYLATHGLLASEVVVHDTAITRELGRLPVRQGLSNAMLAFSPDGSLLAIGNGQLLELWRVVDRRMFSRTATPGDIEAMAFDPTGQRLAVGGAGWAEIRQPMSGVAPIALTGITDVRALAYAADGGRLAGSGSDGSDDQQVLAVWAPEGGAPQRRLAAPGVAASQLWFADGELIAAGFVGLQARVWRAHQPDRRTTLAADPFTETLALRPRPLQLAAADLERTAAVWDPRTGDLVRAVDLHGAAAWEVAASGDGSRIAVHPASPEVGVFDAGGGRVHGIPAGNRSQLVLSADGRRLIIADDDAVRCFVDGAQVWSLASGARRVQVGGDRLLVDLVVRIEVMDAATGALRRTLPRDPAALSADGALIARAETGAVLVEDAGSGARHHRIATAERTVALAVAGDRIAVRDADHWIRVWDWRTRRLLAAWAAPGESVASMSLSPDGSRLVTRGSTTRLWNADSGAAVMAAANTWGQRAELSPDGRLLAVADPGSLLVHDAGSGVVVRTLRGNAPIAWTGDGTYLVSGRGRGIVRLVDPDGKAAARALDVAAYRVREAHFAGAGRLATLAGDRELTSWDLGTSRPRWTWGGDATLESLLVAPAGDRWFALTPRSILAIDATDGDPLGSFDLELVVTASAVRDDGKLIALATRRGPGAPAPVRLLGPRFTNQGQVPVATELRVLRFSADGTRLAGGGNGPLELWTLPGGQHATLSGHQGQIGAIAFRGDGRLLATAAADRTIRLWRLPAGEPIATLAGTLDGPQVVVAADGRVDGSAGDDGGAALLSWQIGDLTLPGFVGWQRQHSPGLLQELLGAKR